MRLLWNKSKSAQLDLLDAVDVADVVSPPPIAKTSTAGQPLQLLVTSLYGDPNNPRTEILDAEIDELAEDIRQHGILQPIVVHPTDAEGRHRIHFGAKRWRAAQRIGLLEVPVVIRDARADPYAQVAENQKRHGLTPIDLARFIKGRADAGDSNAFIAKRMGMNLTTVAHHLSLLELPPVLDQALKTGRCTSPRTLHELSKLHESEPEKIRSLVDGDVEITRNVVTTMKAERSEQARSVRASAQADAIARANAACDRLERALAQVKGPPAYTVALPDLVALRIRVEDLAKKLAAGV